MFSKKSPQLSVLVWMHAILNIKTLTYIHTKRKNYAPYSQCLQTVNGWFLVLRNMLLQHYANISRLSSPVWVYLLNFDYKIKGLNIGLFPSKYVSVSYFVCLCLFFDVIFVQRVVLFCCCCCFLLYIVIEVYK